MSNDIQTISPDTLNTEYIGPDDCVFSCMKNDFLSAEIKGKEYKRVILTRSLPLTSPESYICVSDVDKNEIGIIKDTGIFSEEQKKLINDELNRRYFCPKITEIKSVREKFGNFYFDVLIGDFKKSFTVKDITKNIRYHAKGFDIIDVDGNRYNIEDFGKIAPKSRRKLEPYLY